MGKMLNFKSRVGKVKTYLTTSEFIVISLNNKLKKPTTTTTTTTTTIILISYYYYYHHLSTLYFTYTGYVL